MDKKTKLILSAIGISAVVIPAILLIFLTSKPTPEPPATNTKRQIDTQRISDKVKNLPKGELALPTPVSSTPTASPARESTASGR